MVIVPRTIETTSPSASVVSVSGAARTRDFTRNAVAFELSPAFKIAFSRNRASGLRRSAITCRGEKFRVDLREDFGIVCRCPRE